MSLKALQPGLPLLSSLGYQSLMLVSIHLLQPGRPLLGSLGYQSLMLVNGLICCSLAALSSAVSDPVGLLTFAVWPPSPQQSQMPVSHYWYRAFAAPSSPQRV